MHTCSHKEQIKIWEISTAEAALQACLINSWLIQSKQLSVSADGRAGGGLTEKRGTDHCLWSKNTPPLPTSGHQHNLSTLSLCALQTWQPRREKDQTAAMEIVCSPPPPPHHTSSNPFQISTASYLYLPLTLILTIWYLKIWGWSNKIPQSESWP